MKIDKSLPIHYRYESYSGEGGVTVRVSKFYPVRETKCFYFVVSNHQLLACKSRTYSETPKLRRVSKSSVSGYCHSTQKKALESFKARQDKRIWHAKYSLAVAEQSLLVLDKIEPGDFDELYVGKPEYFKDVIFY